MNTGCKAKTRGTVSVGIAGPLRLAKRSNVQPGVAEVPVLFTIMITLHITFDLWVLHSC